MASTTPEYRQQRARAMAYGRWQPWAEAAPVREHVRQLREAGGTYQAIAAAAGVPTMSVHALMNGQGRVKAETADALLGLTPDRLSAARVPALGTTRRVRALVAMGHSYSRIARALGCHFETVQKLARGEVATATPALQTDAQRLYEAWWNRTPPERTREERAAAEAARRRAERAGWPTGAGLDDDRIEERGYVPQSKWCRAAGTGPAPEDPLGRQKTAAIAKEGSPMPSNSDQRPRRAPEKVSPEVANIIGEWVRRVNGAAPDPEVGRPVVEPWESRRVVELADYRVAYAAHHENDGPPARRDELVASRAARAMRDGGRGMNGTPRQPAMEAEAE